jgi:hypothetical protein
MATVGWSHQIWVWVIATGSCDTTMQIPFLRLKLA